MRKNFSGMSAFSAKAACLARLAAVAAVTTTLATVVALATALPLALPAAAQSTQVALVESVSSDSAGVEIMDYVRAGQVIRLGSHESLVLSYMTSCLRETITGGMVTVGSDRSEVLSGEVTRTRVPCEAQRVVLTSGLNQAGGRAFRGGAH
jgi:hypothetical protein